MNTDTRRVAISLPATGEDEWLAAKEPLMSGWLTQGPKVKAFEEAFAQRHRVPHALATTSCTTGLHLILAGMGIGPGDEVIVPAFTWVATANVVVYCGATPVFADVDPISYNLDPADVARKITPRTKAIMAVHLFGLCADMDGLREVAKGLPILEDAACAAGAAYHGTPAGALGLAAAFSFHPRKSITTGEGGMVTTRDAELNATMDSLRNHGASVSEEIRHHGPKPYLLADFNLLGFNYRMTDLQGAVGLAQLAKLDGFLAERRAKADFYREALADVLWLRCPVVPEGVDHAYQAFVTWVDPDKAPRPRNELMEALQAAGVSTRPGTHAAHALGVYRERFGTKASDCPVAWACDQQTMAIPLHNRMDDEDYAHVVRAIKALG